MGGGGEGDLGRMAAWGGWHGREMQHVDVCGEGDEECHHERQPLPLRARGHHDTRWEVCRALIRSVLAPAKRIEVSRRKQKRALTSSAVHVNTLAGMESHE